MHFVKNDYKAIIRNGDYSIIIIGYNMNNIETDIVETLMEHIKVRDWEHATIGNARGIDHGEYCGSQPFTYVRYAFMEEEIVHLFGKCNNFQVTQIHVFVPRERFSEEVQQLLSMES